LKHIYTNEASSGNQIKLLHRTNRGIFPHIDAGGIDPALLFTEPAKTEGGVGTPFYSFRYSGTESLIDDLTDIRRVCPDP
jgi:hypothetical protein